LRPATLNAIETSVPDTDTEKSAALRRSDYHLIELAKQAAQAVKKAPRRDALCRYLFMLVTSLQEGQRPSRGSRR
jgi:hypothetical protein